GGLPGIRPNGGPAGENPQRQQEMNVPPGREQEMTADRLGACPLFILPRRCPSGGRPPPGTWVAPLAPIQLHARGRQGGCVPCFRGPCSPPRRAHGAGAAKACHPALGFPPLDTALLVPCFRGPLLAPESASRRRGRESMPPTRHSLPGRVSHRPEEWQMA